LRLAVAAHPLMYPCDDGVSARRPDQIMNTHLLMDVESMRSEWIEGFTQRCRDNAGTSGADDGIVTGTKGEDRSPQVSCPGSRGSHP